ncbi:hypothetical protein AGDE_15083 [Angomonas deanei]|nr:hypothetical protein AGDE_15083 [Angomonas deanei]|eukprot:EPY19713.1 hypothetical protein AGDE_15083 [Angomonas deanei]
MTSLLGRTEEQRKSVASFLQRQMTDNPEESFLQTTLVDCLHIYAKKGNEADVTALNFLFSLQQAEGCFLPPPRIVDESFWWLSAISDIWQSHSQQPSTRRRQVETADAVYEKLFSSVMSRQDLKMLLLSNINKCNTLLTLLSPSLPVRQSDMMTVEEVREFVSKYKVLRKNLYLFDFLCKVFCLCDQQSQEEDGNSGDVITEDQLDALRRSVMELILQSLIRIPFAAGVEDSVDNRTHLASSEQSAASVRTYLSQISSSSNSKSRAKIVDNVLLGTTTKTVTGGL